MFPYKDVICALLLFIPSVWALTKFKKQSSFSQKIIFLTLSLVILLNKGTIPFLIFMASFVPLLSLEVPLSPSDEPKKVPTTIQEKMVVYLAMMPLFGLLILKREEFDKNLLQIKLPIEQLWVTEIILVVCILLTIAGNMRLRKR
jgi:hypothetical protein